MKKEYIIGLDIGGTKCAASLAEVSENIKIMNKISFATENLSPDVVLLRFSAFIEENLKVYNISAIGISCGGPLDSNLGIIMKPPSLELWDNIEIVKFFQNKFGIKTRIQNDANACAIAEWKFGAGKGCNNMVFLTFGTGFGAGLILNGKLYSGTNDNAGEIGHIRLTKDGPMGYNKKGSCEGYCSGSGIKRLAEIMIKKDNSGSKKFIEKIGGINNITAKNLAEEAKNGDLFCKKVYKKSGEMLGRSLSIIVDLLNPERIIIGGVFMRSSELLTESMYVTMKKECLSYSYNAVKILKAGLGEEVGDYAAIAVACGDY